ncbi:MAG TPA: iron ABC transporter permease [Candidatus Eisenbergiella stercorigallinarum]|uniref:Iron ABC transporter permease n=1 Tax=Candidatus Eisenbergiella stercorigallinarum TaxID=2838557 RepID=A0A9D2U0M9_9FIRM|nr:iron ABC transporter permease [Candidatus Eisenbergiella stercorigallinarum]
MRDWNKRKKQVNKRRRLFLLLLICLLTLAAGAGVGSVAISPTDILAILGNRLFSLPLPEDISPNQVSILWTLRLPRCLCAFLVGGALAASGTVMQSVLRNPLASSYTLGVSSGASLGAAIVIVTGLTLPFAGFLTLPLAGFVFGLGTVFAVIAFASRMDRGLQNQTIILTGMVFSLFVNALLTLLSVLEQNYMQQLLLWQMGSFSGRSWQEAGILFAVLLPGVLYLCLFSRQMDMMTFGEEAARTMGVDTKRVKLKLIVAASLLTGTAVCFTGTIGFIDLIAPHVARRVFGPAHRYALPVSVLFGGAFMVLSDLAARTVMSPTELPVGAVTALIGAPFFAWVYFKGRGHEK